MPAKLAHRMQSLVAIVALSAVVSSACPFENVLDTPAQYSRIAEVTLLNGVCRAGDRVVAVGPRGHVLLSDASGGAWKQVTAPVSADLTSVHFVSASIGWAVGHGATILRTLDGGLSWTRQLDGREAARLMVEQYQRAVARGNKNAALALAEARRFAEEGPGRPFLAVWFRDARMGFAVGAFNLIFRTDDGGRTWVSWFDRAENPKLANLYAVTGDSHTVYIAGEQGLLLKLDEERKHFNALVSDYQGSYFGALIPVQGSLVVYGMRGNVFLTADDGAHWRKIESNDPAGITGGTALGDGRAVLVSQSGRALLYTPGNDRLTPVPIDRPMSFTSVAVDRNGRLTLAGFGGVRSAIVAPLSRLRD